MAEPTVDRMSQSAIYDRRFPDRDRARKSSVWRVLCREFLQRYVSGDATVLDLGAGFCEFLHHIDCAQRIAVDANERLSEWAPVGTRLIITESPDFEGVNDDSVDVVFASNFFEHLRDKESLFRYLVEIRRVLKPRGRLLVIQPNVRLLGGSYWDFIDHHIPLTDRSMAEALELSGLEVEEILPRFLPYTTRSRMPQHPMFVRLYLKLPFLWSLLGKQTWFVARKEGCL